MAAKKKMEKKAEETKEVIVATVVGDRPLNIRSGKTTEENNIVGKLLPGEQITILKVGKLWCKIEQGYVMRQFLAF